VKFLDTGEKIKDLRKKLNIKQEELNIIGVSRNFISMIENGKRKLPQCTAVKLMEIFKKKADELNINLDVDENWLMISAKAQATEFCNEKLDSNFPNEDIDTMTSLVKEYNIQELVPKVYMLKANNLYDKRLYEEAFTYYYEILDNLKNDNTEKASIYNKLSKCKIMMLNYMEAITYLNKCYEYCILSNDIATKKNCLYNMALTYFKLGSYELSLNSMDSFIKLCDLSKDFKEYIWAILLESNCYIENKKYQKSINMLSDIIDKFKDTEDLLLGYVYNNLGLSYLENNELDKALLNLDKAEIIRQSKDRYNLSHTIFNKAKILMKQKMMEQSLELVNKSIALAEEFNDYEFIINNYKLLETLYFEQGKNSDFINLYLNMIGVFKKIDNKEEVLKAYIKLLSIIEDNGDTDSYKYYLAEARKV
jgi:HTH-type transcriptional regulator, quorum sensing regulator NprR